MIDINIIIIFGICILGMLGAFFLGTRMSQERVLGPSKKYDVEEPEGLEVTDQQYEESLTAWKHYGPNKDTEQREG